MSAQNGIPVRVIRGHEHRSPYSPPAGYEYAGLYRVAAYWEEIGRSGHRIWRYRLERVQEDVAEPPMSPPSLETSDESATLAPRQVTTIQRIVRNSAVGQRVKHLHDFRCQVCGEQLVTGAGPYIEAAHIRPLGRPHDGPDHEGNILVLCPNHHVLFDFGALAVTETFHVLNTVTGDVLGELRCVPRHAIDPVALAYHCEHIAGLPDTLRTARM